MPVVRPLPQELLRPCVPRYMYPDGDLSIAAVIDRLEAVEMALAVCANQIEVIRSMQEQK